MVGKAIARDLESLQDKMPPFPQSEAEAAVAAAFGKPLTQVYASFGPAVAAASIAQVHRAEVEMEDGKRKPVAVKVLRPGIERRFKSDLDAFFFVARKAEELSLEAQRLRLGRSGGDARALGGDRDGFPPGGGGRSPRWRRTPATIPASACRRSTGTAPRARC